MSIQIFKIEQRVINKRSEDVLLIFKTFIQLIMNANRKTKIPNP
jgi:hypothetical protein